MVAADTPHAPQIGPELAEEVTQLGLLRRQLKELEGQENRLRDRILTEIGEWPREFFPVKVGQFEVRVSERKGRVDVAQSSDILTREHLLREVPWLPEVRDADELETLSQLLARLPMPDETRNLLMQCFKAAIDFRPGLSFEVLSAFYEHSRLTLDQYRACFRDGKPLVSVLTVR